MGVQNEHLEALAYGRDLWQWSLFPCMEENNRPFEGQGYVTFSIFKIDSSANFQWLSEKVRVLLPIFMIDKVMLPCTAIDLLANECT